jgi:beta-galactosidase
VSLFLNDKQIALQKQTRNEASTYLNAPPYSFVLPQFEPGKLKAYGLNQRQIRIASDEIQTPGKPTRIRLSIDTLGRSIDTLKADLIFIRATLLDANGTVVPTNDYKVTFSIIAQDAGLVCPAIQPIEAGIASALLRTEAPKNPIIIKVSLSSLGFSDQLIWQP